MQLPLPNQHSISASVASSSPTRCGDQNQCRPIAACSPIGPPSGLLAAATIGSVWLGRTRLPASREAGASAVVASSVGLDTPGMLRPAKLLTRQPPLPFPGPPPPSGQVGKALDCVLDLVGRDEDDDGGGELGVWLGVVGGGCGVFGVLLESSPVPCLPIGSTSGNF